MAKLRVQEVKERFFIVLAERGANAHVAHNSAGYAGRESLGRSVAARAVLLKNAFAGILRLTALIPNGVLERLGAWRAALLCGKC
jgi:hypothetical protein